MKAIYKYQILPPGVEISMPIGAKIVAVHEQDDGVYMWAEAYGNNTHETRRFSAYATGQEIVGAKQYLGTAFLKNGLVFHVYEMV